MEEIYFTSDTHFGHRRIMEFCGTRPGSSVEEHDEILIENWNSLVRKQDRIYHLGDFGGTKAPFIESILRRLNGQKFFVYGNHDYKTMKKYLADKYFQWAGDYKEIKGPDKVKICLSHYPLLSWHKIHRKAWNLHGHCHGNLPNPDLPWQVIDYITSQRQLDVGVDCWNYYPVHIEELAEKMKKKKFIPVDGHYYGFIE